MQNAYKKRINIHRKRVIGIILIAIIAFIPIINNFEPTYEPMSTMEIGRKTIIDTSVMRKSPLGLQATPSSTADYFVLYSNWTTQNSLVVFKNNQFLTEIPFNDTNSVVYKKIVDDVDNDGKPEIILTTDSYGKIYLIEGDTFQITYSYDISINNNQAAIVELVVRDINGDGNKEIVLGVKSFESSVPGGVYIFNSSLSLLAKIAPLTPTVSRSGPHRFWIRDIDNDGDLDMVLFYGNYQYGNYGTSQPHFMVLDISNMTNPTVLYQWQKSLYGMTWASLGKYLGEWVVFYGGWGYDNLYANFLLNGSALWTKPISSGADIPVYYIGTVPGLNGNYIFTHATSYGDASITYYMLNVSDGSTVWSITRTGRGWIPESIYDYDSDGDLELSLTLWKSSTNNFLVVNLKTGSVEQEINTYNTFRKTSSMTIFRNDDPTQRRNFDIDGDGLTDFIVFKNSTHFGKLNPNGTITNLYDVSKYSTTFDYAIYTYNLSSLTVTSDKTEYSGGEQVTLTANTGASTGESVTFEVRYPNGSLHSIWVNTTDAGGIATYSFTLPGIPTQGTYTAYASWNSQTASTTFNVTIPLTVNSPTDFSYEYGSTGNIIAWVATSSIPQSYTVYRNGVGVGSGSWVSGVSIDFNVDGLTLGTYNYTVVFSDQAGSTIIDTVFVTVVDTTNPTVDSPSDIAYYSGEVGNQITWNPSDLLPASYTITRNGTTVASGSWSGGAIVHSVDGLSVGIHEYVLTVFDSSGNSASDIVLVTVKPTDIIVLDSMTITGTLTADGTINVTLVISNYYATSQTVTIVVQILDPNGVPLTPQVITVTMNARSEGNVYSFIFNVNGSGTYLVQGIVLTALPSEGGKLILYASNSVTVI